MVHGLAETVYRLVGIALLHSLRTLGTFPVVAGQFIQSLVVPGILFNANLQQTVSLTVVNTYLQHLLHPRNGVRTVVVLQLALEIEATHQVGSIGVAVFRQAFQLCKTL